MGKPTPKSDPNVMVLSCGCRVILVVKKRGTDCTTHKQGAPLHHRPAAGKERA